MNTYVMTTRGTIENTAGFLSDLVENKTTPLNRNYEDLKFNGMDWESSFKDSRAIINFSTASTVSRNDIATIREQYGLKVTNRKSGE